MRILNTLGTLGLTLAISGLAHAQDVRITYPQANQDVRGEITARFEGIPAGGYAIVRVDNQFKQATAQNSVVFDTISDRTTFTRGDGQYKISVEVLNASGGRVGRDEVSFNVANSKVDPVGEAVRLVHWSPSDRTLTSVQRYRVFAESNAIIDNPTQSAAAAPTGGEGGIPGGVPSAAPTGGGGGSATPTDIPAPLDYQVTALLRRTVRDVGLYQNSANIATIVQDAFERGREGGQSGAGATLQDVGAAPTRRTPTKASSSGKKGWLPVWTRSRENGTYFIKMIKQNGTEINATRKAPTVSLADLLPTFPDATIRPGTTWQSSMTILTDLTTREGINVSAPVTFTSYDNILTAAGESRRCAKIETRFRLPEEISKRIAAALASKVGGAGGAGTGATGTEGGAGGAPMSGAPMGAATGATGTAAGLLPDDIDVARTDMARVLWFDMDRHQIVRSEDTIRTYFEMPNTAGAAGGASTAPMTMMGPDGGAGGAAAPAQPQKVTYNMNVTTLLDDRIPQPNEGYSNGIGTAHGRDSVIEPGISRITRP